jgi:hypothetical protein
MRLPKLIRLSLRHYRATNLAIVAGVTITVTVLTGALLVGDSVRGSLRDLHLLRLGETAYVITADGFFREALADDLEEHPRFRDKFVGAVAVIALEGMVTHEPSGLRGSGVQVYGVDTRFWEFHSHPMKDALQDGALSLSSSLAEEFQAGLGDSMLVRVQRHSTVPSDSLHGRKTNLARSLRFKVGAILEPQDLGEFSLRPQQGAVRAAFLPLKQLQESLRQEGRVNTILVSAPDAETVDRADDLGAILRRAASVQDLGIRLRALETQRALSIESERILIQDRVVEKAHQAAEELGFRTISIFSYLANTIRTDAGEIPYSLVTAIAPEPDATQLPKGINTLPPIWLNEWAWRDLGAQLGDEVTLEYYQWEDGGELLTRTAQFHLGGVLPMDGIGGDRNLAPDFPGITESERVSGWDPPFPIDLTRIRDRDEDYWDRYRAAPKAILPLEVGQRLWQSRYGKLTAIRFLPPDTLPLTAAHDALRERLQAALDPLQTGFAIYAVRAEGAKASRGAVNFGELFQLFPGCLCTAAHRPVFPPGHRAAASGDWSAASYRLLFTENPGAFPRRGNRPGRPWELDGPGRRCRVRLADDVRPANLVGRCRGHDAAHSSSLSDLSGHGGAGGCAGRAADHPGSPPQSSRRNCPRPAGRDGYY